MGFGCVIVLALVVEGLFRWATVRVQGMREMSRFELVTWNVSVVV